MAVDTGIVLSASSSEGSNSGEGDRPPGGTRTAGRTTEFIGS